METLTSFYDVLGIGPTADADTLRKAYRRLARKHHPDVSRDPRAHENMARINEAFETLIDSSRRLEYDAMLAGGGVVGAPENRRNHAKPVVVRLLRRMSGHQTPVYALTFAEDSGQLVSSAFDNELIWWNEATGIPKRRLKIESGTISTLRAATSNRVFGAGSAENQVNFCQIKADGPDSWRTADEEWAGAVAISPNGKFLATGSLHHTLSVFDTATGRCLFRRADHDSAVTCVAWSADGAFIATGSADASVKIWDAATGNLVETIHQIRSAVTAVAFSNDGKFLIAAAVDLSIRVFTLYNRQLVKMMFGHTKVVESLAFHPNGWLYASGSRDGTVGLWNAAKGIGNVRLECSSRPISCIEFSPDGTRLACGSQDKLIRLWEVVAKESA